MSASIQAPVNVIERTSAAASAASLVKECFGEGPRIALCGPLLEDGRCA
jgi:hypothetical protein